MRPAPKMPDYSSSPQTTVAPSAALPFIPELHGLRGVAACAVMLFHFSFAITGDSDSLPRTLADQGRLGVDLFFVLSGFLIGSIVCQFHDRPNFLKAFYGRRFFRIAPLFYATLILTYLAYHVASSYKYDPTVPYWAYALLVNDIVGSWKQDLGDLFVAWSLAVEEKFYLVVPLVARYGSHFALGVFAGVVTLASLAWQFWLSAKYRGQAPFPTLCIRWEGLGLGMALAIYTTTKGLEIWKTRSHRRAAVFSLGVTTAILALPLSANLQGAYFFRYSVFFLALVVTVLSYRGTKAFSWLRTGFAGWLGTISYGIYLLHPISHKTGIWLAQKASFPANGWSGVLLGVVLTFTLAPLSWYFWEKRFVAFASRKYRY